MQYRSQSEVKPPKKLARRLLLKRQRDEKAKGCKGKGMQRQGQGKGLTPAKASLRSLDIGHLLD
jgi:hypothetical protein